MKRKIYVLLALLLSFAGLCSGQASPTELYLKEYNWHITIPRGYERISSEEMAKIQKKGAARVEETFDEKMGEIPARAMFGFRDGKTNFLEAVQQPYDVAVSGDHATSFRTVGDIMTKTMASQAPDSKVDTTYSVETIDGLEFQLFSVTLKAENKPTINMLMFCRLFDKRELAFNVVYVEKKKGKEMLSAFRESKFH